MRIVSQQQLQCMGTRRQFDNHLGLTTTEMTMPGISRDRPAKIRDCGIDKQVMMPGLRLVDAGWSHTHSGQAEDYLDG